MSEEKKNTPETEAEEPEIVTLLDENNQEIRFELIGGCVDQGKQYFALIPEGSADEDGGFEEYIILRQDGDEMVEIEDDAEFDRVAKIFDEAFDAEVDYDA